MTDEKVPAVRPLSDDERRILEAVIMRSALSSTPKEEPKPSKWKNILDSTVLTGLITVVLGGVFGNYILANYQEHAKEHERELAERKDLLKRQEDVASSADQLLGEAHFHAAALLSLTSSGMQPSHYPKEKWDKLDKHREKINNDATDFSRRWEQEKYKTGMQLSFVNDYRVHVAWETAQKATDDMLAKAQQQFALYQGSPTAPTVYSIDTEEDKFLAAVDELGGALKQAHRMSVEGLR